MLFWGPLENFTPWTSLWDIYRMSLGCCRKTWNYETANSLVFQAKMLWNKIENNERFEIDVLRTSQGRYHMDVFLGRFEDIHRTVLQNYNNMQNLTFRYFTQHIQWSKINSNVLFDIFSNWRPPDFPRTSLQDAIRTSLGCLPAIFE